MKTYSLDYPLSQGFVDHWLVLGPCSQPASRKEEGDPVPPFLLPATPGAKVTCAGKDHFWQIDVVGEDRRVERSLFSSRPERLHLWAYCRLYSPKSEAVQAVLTVLSPAMVWVNEAIFHRQPSAGTASFDLPLRAGDNDLLILVETEAYRESTLSLALQLHGSAAADVSTRLPVRSEYTDYWKEVENLYASARTDQAVFTPQERISVSFPTDQPRGAEINLRVQAPGGRAYGEFAKEVNPGDQMQSMYAQQLNSGDYEVLLMPALQHYYENEFRVSRRLPFQVANERYYAQPQAAPDDRLIALMREAARRQRLEGEIAKFALGWWREVDLDILKAALERVQNQAAGSALDLLLLTGVLVRMGVRPDFPPQLRAPIEDVVALAFFETAPEARTESEELLFGAARALAAHYFTLVQKTITGLNNEPAAAQQRQQLTHWLRERAQAGFACFGSAYDEIVAALTHLTDLLPETAEEDEAAAGEEESENPSESLPEMAAVLLDKVLFTLALHSWRGVMAAPQARANAGWLRSGRLHPAAAIAYLLWGTGSITNEMAGAVSLGLSRNYRIPELLRAIALDPGDVWSHERSRAADGEANLALYKTADFALSSLQDYRPGQRGEWTHTWQATLGPEAVVFTNHPGALKHSNHRPFSFWAGSESLPRIAQWQDALVCLYNLPENAWLPFTHAYFPTAAFDEHRFEGGWAFARKGDGYLALYAAPGFQLAANGDEAGRELRAYGQQAAWLCQMGRQSVDGSFEAFIGQVLANPPEVEGLRVTWQSLHSRLAFDWNGPLLVDGQEQPLSAFPLFENPFAQANFPAPTLQIQYGDEAMILDFQ